MKYRFRLKQFASRIVRPNKLAIICIWEMWPDDPHWMPLFFAGKKFQGKILFGEKDAILEMDIEEVSSLL
jgi:hypothetical protein